MSSKLEKRILHVDINSYFATILQQENPNLRNRPIGVVKDKGRTCIIAASKEAKKLGIRTGSLASEARFKAPELLLVPARFAIYLDCTRRLKRIFSDLAPTVDIFSLDEAFIDITDCSNIYPDAEAFARQIQAQIKLQLGEWVTCNVGISYTRLLAKLASEVSPKGSVTTINSENRDGYLSQASFSDICGVGYRLEKKLSRLGITNPYQINFFTKEDLEPLVGPFWVKELLKIAQGQDSKTLSGIDERRQQPMKSVGRTITGFKLCDDEETIKQMLYNLSEEAAHKIRQMEMSARHVGVLLTGSGRGAASRSGHSWYRHKTLPRYIHRTQDVFELIYQFYQQWERSFAVIRFGVFLSDLKPLNQVQSSLFETEQQKDILTQAVDQINSRYGLFTVRPATLVKARLIRPEVTGFLGDRIFHGL